MLESVKEICAGRGPLLLALSGGPDSLALYYLLKEVGHPFEVAHVDHGWREESGEEAARLQEIVDVPFHLTQLKKGENNLEDRARKGRLAFFGEILHTRGLEGVLLGHHQDDLAETVLKRLFEGARLTKLAGLERENEVEGIQLLRPLLPFRKKEIVKWLGMKGIEYFIDSSDGDLRSRMRKEIFPTLAAHFGKEIVPSLCRIAEYAKELRDFQDSFLLKSTVADFFEDKRVAISRPTLNAVCGHLQRGSSKKVMRIGKGNVVIEHGILTYNKRIDEE